jgi:glycosyltransferase involved in cell wall biosynthesis
MNKSLSIVVLTKNEEDVIADCLENLSGFGSEILVIDAGSTDRTVQIAEHLGAKIVVHSFEDFASQRNFAIKKTHEDFVLYIDADEQVTPEFKKEVQSIIENFKDDGSIAGYFLKRKTFYFGKDWGLEDQVQRLFFKERFQEWFGVVHETPKIDGAFGTIKSPILHFTHRNLSQMLTKTNEWSQYEAELRFKAKHPKMNIIRFIRVMITAFLDSYFKNKGYKNGTYGFVEATYQTFSLFITYAKLWEMQNTKQGERLR